MLLMPGSHDVWNLQAHMRTSFSWENAPAPASVSAKLYKQERQARACPRPGHALRAPDKLEFLALCAMS